MSSRNARGLETKYYSSSLNLKNARHNKSNSLIDLISSMDTLGISPSLYIQKSTKFKTVRGGILTILLYIFGLATFFVLGRDLYLRKSPFIVVSKTFLPEPSYNFTENDFYAAALVYDTGRLIKDLDRRVDVYLSYLMYDVSRIFPNTGSFADRKRIELVKCNESKKVQENFLDVQQKLLSNQSYYWCINNTIKESLDGRLGSSKFNEIQFRVDICKNTTENNNKCLPEKQIREEMSLMFLHFIYTNSYLDGLNFTKPTNYLLQAELFRGSSLAYRRDYFYYKKVEFYSDANWILEGFEKENSLQLDTYSSDIVSDTSTTIFYAVQITLSQIMEVYTRKYIKVQEIAASVGGIFKFFQQIFFLFIIFSSKNDYVKTVILNAFKLNKVFNDEDRENNSNYEWGKIIKNQSYKINECNINNYIVNNNDRKGLSVNRNDCKYQNESSNQNSENNLKIKNSLVENSNENKNNQVNLRSKNNNFLKENISEIKELRVIQDNNITTNNENINNTSFDDKFLSSLKNIDEKGCKKIQPIGNPTTPTEELHVLKNSLNKESSYKVPKFFQEKKALGLNQKKYENSNTMKNILTKNQNINNQNNNQCKYRNLNDFNSKKDYIINSELRETYKKNLSRLESKKFSVFESFYISYFAKEKRRNKDTILFSNLISFIEKYMDITKLIRTYLKIQIVKKRINLTGDDQVLSYYKKFQKFFKD